MQGRPEDVLKLGKYNGEDFVFTFTKDEGAYDGKVCVSQGIPHHKNAITECLYQYTYICNVFI